MAVRQETSCSKDDEHEEVIPDLELVPTRSAAQILPLPAYAQKKETSFCKDDDEEMPDLEVIPTQGVTQALPLPANTPQPHKRRRLGALGFARFVASVHIVCGHFYSNISPFASWGGSWVPFFFLLSGFVLTYSRLSSKSPEKTEPLSTFMRKRLSALYPLFLFSIILQVAMDSWRLQPLTFNQIWSLPWTLLWLHGWSWHVDDCDPNSYKVCVSSYNMPTWFLTALFAYWLLWTPLYHLIRKMSHLWIKVGMAGCFLYGFLWQSIFWANGWVGDSYPWGTPWLQLAKFSPITFWHIFVFGMLMARLFVDSDGGEQSRGLVLVWSRCGVIVGYACLLMLFILYGTPERELPVIGNIEVLFRAALMLPFQAVLLWGLAAERDPLARLFTFRPFVWGEQISYPQYILQQPIFTLVQGWFWTRLDMYRLPSGSPVWTQFYMALYITLFCSACFSAIFIDRPYRAWLEAAPRTTVIAERNGESASEQS